MLFSLYNCYFQLLCFYAGWLLAALLWEYFLFVCYFLRYIRSVSWSWKPLPIESVILECYQVRSASKICYQICISLRLQALPNMKSMWVTKMAPGLQTLWLQLVAIHLVEGWACSSFSYTSLPRPLRNEDLGWNNNTSYPHSLTFILAFLFSYWMEISWDVAPSLFQGLPTSLFFL